MNIYIYDDEKEKTEIIEIDDTRVEDNPDLEFFNDNDIRKVWHSGEEEWYLSIVDVVHFLTDSKDPKQYIKKCVNVTRNFPLSGVQYVPHFKCLLRMEK